MEEEIFYMKRCLELAERGLGHTATNPMVACVIVYEGVIIGEGYHEHFGGPHAEVNALASVANPNLITFSTAYVNLEPCAHYGKTPPCCDLLIQKGIRRVVMAMQDPFPSVNGEGIRRLKEAGIELEIGLMEEEARFLNRRFIRYHQGNRPYVILKWAQTADGFIGQYGNGIPISNPLSKVELHRWRSEEAALLIGPDTAINDNPFLTNRLAVGPNPQRVLLDRNLRVPKNLNLFNDGKPLWVMNTLTERKEGPIRYMKVGAQDFLSQSLMRLHSEGMVSVLVEGGAAIHQAFMQQNLWDEARIGVSPIYLENGVQAPKWPSGMARERHINDDSWFYFQNEELALED